MTFNHISWTRHRRWVINASLEAVKEFLDVFFSLSNLISCVNESHAANFYARCLRCSHLIKVLRFYQQIHWIRAQLIVYCAFVQSKGRWFFWWTFPLMHRFSFSASTLPLLMHRHWSWNLIKAFLSSQKLLHITHHEYRFSD